MVLRLPLRRICVAGKRDCLVEVVADAFCHRVIRLSRYSFLSLHASSGLLSFLKALLVFLDAAFCPIFCSWLEIAFFNIK
uniref:Uncharacterized protein n=1 Tax=Malurus cyaneus samueli TaxID=2593467 RepID=A0A8C5TDA7_9PASS